MTARKDWFGTITGGVAFNPDLSTSAKAIYLVLVMFRNRDDDTCYPSNETLSRHTGLGNTTVKKALGELVTAGVIERTPRFKDGRQITSLTTLSDHRGSRGGPPGGSPSRPQNTPSKNTKGNPDSPIRCDHDYSPCPFCTPDDSTEETQ